MAVVICTECGERSPEGVQFCGGCGTYLEWAEPAPTNAPVDRERAGDPPAGRARSAGARETTVPSAPADAMPSQGGPVVRRPDEVAHRPHVAMPEEPEPPKPGERPCPACGAGNDAARRFCRSCGDRLAERAPAAPRRSWWRRLLRVVFGPRVHRAGDRRQISEPGRWRRPVVLMALLLTVVVVLLLPARQLLDRAIGEIQDRTSTRVPVTPVAVRASSEASGAGAERVIDGASNRYWAPAGKPEGAWVEVDFAQPVRLLDIIVTSGASTDRQQFLSEGRPHELKVTVTTQSGEATGTTLTLHDAPGGQQFGVRASDVVHVRFVIKSTFGMQGATRCAFAEIEFFARG